MTPPSAIAKGGSSLIALLRTSLRSERRSRFRCNWRNLADFNLARAAATTGKRPIDARSAINSRGLAVPTVILLSKRSRSNTPSNDERVSSNSTSELTSSPTAYKRHEITAGAIDGRTNQLRNKREPLPDRV